MKFHMSDLNYLGIAENDSFYQEVTILISKCYNGCYEKDVHIYFKNWKSFEKLFWKRSDLLQRLIDWNLGGNYLPESLKNEIYMILLLHHTKSSVQQKLPNLMSIIFFLYN